MAGYNRRLKKRVAFTVSRGLYHIFASYSFYRARGHGGHSIYTALLPAGRLKVRVGARYASTGISALMP